MVIFSTSIQYPFIMTIHRSIIKVSSLVITLLVISCQGRKEGSDSFARAREIHEKVLTVDTHADTPLGLDHINLRGVISAGERAGKVDFPRMKEGGLDAIFFAVYVAQGPFDEESYKIVRGKRTRIWLNQPRSLMMHCELKSSGSGQCISELKMVMLLERICPWLRPFMIWVQDTSPSVIHAAMISVTVQRMMRAPCIMD
jgi:hypothetical protein